MQIQLQSRAQLNLLSETHSSGASENRAMICVIASQHALGQRIYHNFSCVSVLCSVSTSDAFLCDFFFFGPHDCMKH